MKKAAKLILGIYLMLHCISSQAQNLYSLDFSNPAGFTTTGGTLNNGKWTARNEYCTLVSTAVNFPGNPAIDPRMVSTVVVTAQSTGNLDCSEVYPDGAFVRYSINNGAWVNQSFITTCGSSGNNYITSFKLNAPAGASIRIMVNLVVNSMTEKIWLMDGGIVIQNPVVSTETSWIKRVAKQDSDNQSNITPELSVFPNPTAGDNINIQLKNSNSEVVQISFIDLTGRLCLSKQLTTTDGSVNETISTNGLKSGLYTCVINGNNETVRERIIITE